MAALGGSGVSARRAASLHGQCLAIEAELVAAAHGQDVARVDELLDLLRVLSACQELEGAIIASIAAGDEERTTALRLELASLTETLRLTCEPLS